MLVSWELHLRAERKSAQTVRSYTLGVRLFLGWCERTATPPELSRRVLAAFTASLLDAGAEKATARARQLAVRRFSAWLADEGEIDRDGLLGVKPPKLDVKITPILTDDQVAKLIKVCVGREFRDRRDEAIVRLMVETGLRSEEVLSMTIPDTDLGSGQAIIRRGKGGKGRTVWFGPSTTRSLDRYLRQRRTHRLAGTPTLWLGDRGKEFRYHALRDTLRWRAGLAGLPGELGFSPHKLRHTAASRWLDAGGSEGGLMAMAGCARRDMIDRDRALPEPERLRRAEALRRAHMQRLALRSSRARAARKASP